jgi:uncharacterized protein YaiE (UPF0345 family)
MKESTAQIIDYINSNHSIEHLEIVVGKGVFFSDDTWDMYEDGNEHHIASRSKFSFSEIQSESLNLNRADGSH